MDKKTKQKKKETKKQKKNFAYSPVTLSQRNPLKIVFIITIIINIITNFPHIVRWHEGTQAASTVSTFWKC